MFTRFAATSVALAALASAIPQAVDVATGPTIHIDANTKYQVYDGIGLSEAFQRSLVMHELDAKAQTLVLDMLFDNKTGAGFNILRNGLGSSPDQPFDHMESIAPMAPKSNSSALKYQPLSKIRGDEYQLWLSKEAISRGVYSVYADAWSADGYMKTNNDTNNGGYLCGVTNTSCATGDWRQSYANKIVKYIQDYQAEGIKINHIGFLNEPDLNTTYASMQSSGQQAADFIEILYPTLQRANLSSVGIACCDGSGWEQNRERLTGLQAAGAEQYLDIVTSHAYSSPIGAAFNTTKRVWMTEYATYDPTNYAWASSVAPTSQSDGITWAQHLMMGFGTSNTSAFFYWWGAANTTDNESLILITPNGTDAVVPTKRLYAYQHYGSRFLYPTQSYRVAATLGGSGTSNLNVTAFSNPDGSMAVQVLNSGSANATVSLTGIKLGKNAEVTTYTTDNERDFDQAKPISTNGGKIVGLVPAQALVSFVIGQ